MIPLRAESGEAVETVLGYQYRYRPLWPFALEGGLGRDTAVFGEEFSCGAIVKVCPEI